MTRLIDHNSQYGPLHLFTPTIWRYQYQFDWACLKPKIDHLFFNTQKNSELEKGDAVSTVSSNSSIQPHTWIELDNFMQWLDTVIPSIAKYLNFQNLEQRVTNSWINRHNFGGETIEHNHNNVIFVVSCYLKCPPQSGNIVFKDPLEYHKSHWPIFPEQHLYSEVPVTTNDVLIFPGYLKHYVTKSVSDDSRYVMTLNIK